MPGAGSIPAQTPVTPRDDVALPHLDQRAPPHLKRHHAFDAVLAAAHLAAHEVEGHAFDHRKERDRAEALVPAGGGALLLVDQVVGLPDPRTVHAHEAALVVGAVLPDQAAGADDERSFDPRMRRESVTGEPSLEGLGQDRVPVTRRDRTLAQLGRDDGTELTQIVELEAGDDGGCEGRVGREGSGNGLRVGCNHGLWTERIEACIGVPTVSHGSPTLASDRRESSNHGMRDRVSGAARGLTLCAIFFVSGLVLGCAQQRHTGAVPDPTDPSGPRGHLVIVGGGLQADHAEVFTAFFGAADQTDRDDRLILVLPTASGVPERSTARTIAALESHAPPGYTVQALPIRHDAPEAARDPALVARIDLAAGVWFVGGQQSRIVSTFAPDGESTPALEALHRLLAAGGCIGGTSAGAAMMCDPMIAGGRSAAAVRDPQEVRMSAGLGFFTAGLVDQHFVERGRFGRLCAALVRTGTATGYGIAENSALAVDRARQTARVVGRYGVVQLTVEHGAPDSALEFRVSLLDDGARVDLRDGRATTAVSPHAGVVAIPPQPDSPWDRDALEGLALAFIDEDTSTLSVHDPDATEVTVRRTPATRVVRHQSADGAARTSVLDLGLSIQAAKAR